MPAQEIVVGVYPFCLLGIYLYSIISNKYQIIWVVDDDNITNTGLVPDCQALRPPK